MRFFFDELRQQIGPAYLGGFSFTDWVRFLHCNHWEIEPRFLPRAAHASLRTVATSALKCLENRIDLSGVDEQAWRKPVFLLGLPRSGTTHLFNLLARDSRFGFPTRFDVFNPHTFLTLRELGLHHLLARRPTLKRPMDNVEVGWLSPEEDNIALGILAGSGPRVESIFPQSTTYADRFRPLRERSEEERRAFREALALFTRKLVYACNRPLLLKSPAHALCIEDILTVFPEAKFIGIARDPLAQFASLRHMIDVTRREGWATLQESPEITDAELLARIEQHVDAYCRARHSIPVQNLVEIRYENLVEEQADTMTRIYSCLGLGWPVEFACSESAKSYVSNRHAAPDPSLAEKLREIYRPFYDSGLLSEQPTRQ
jgi:omega-hydroxy-beta-dihydromenaquinone-9 sulfotransferase